MRSPGLSEYVAMNQELLGFHRAANLLHQFEDGDHVCSIYELSMATPSGGSRTLTIADWLRVEDGKITEQRISFDPRELAEAFEM